MSTHTASGTRGLKAIELCEYILFCQCSMGMLTDDFPLIAVDALRFEPSILDLFSNAVRYAGEVARVDSVFKETAKQSVRFPSMRCSALNKMLTKSFVIPRKLVCIGSITLDTAGSKPIRRIISENR